MYPHSLLCCRGFLLHRQNVQNIVFDARSSTPFSPACFNIKCALDQTGRRSFAIPVSQANGMAVMTPWDG